LPAPLFTVGAPLAENGPIVAIALTARQRRLPRRLILFYRSQWRSFVGLGPLIVWQSLTRRSLAVQRSVRERLLQRPTARPLLYEVRNGVGFDQFRAKTAPFLAAHSGAARQAGSARPRRSRAR
jgi:hypothetical protein